MNTSSRSKFRLQPPYAAAKRNSLLCAKKIRPDAFQEMKYFKVCARSDGDCCGNAANTDASTGNSEPGRATKFCSSAKGAEKITKTGLNADFCIATDVLSAESPGLRNWQMPICAQLSVAAKRRFDIKHHPPEQTGGLSSRMQGSVQETDFCQQVQ
jgi:hypothetical protein